MVIQEKKEKKKNNKTQKKKTKKKTKKQKQKQKTSTVQIENLGKKISIVQIKNTSQTNREKERGEKRERGSPRPQRKR